MKSAIIVDSTSYLDEKLSGHPDVYTVNLSVHFHDGSDLMDTANYEEQQAFYARLLKETHLPTTSQPKPGDYYALLDQLIEADYEVVYCVHLSSEISGTFQTAQMITDEYKDKLTIYCVNSKAASIVMGRMVEQALDDIQKGLAPSEIHEHLIWFANESRVYLMVEDLNNLVKGGRLSATSAFLGGMLKIRPLLYFDAAGKITLFEKIRTNKKVYRRWHELIEESLAKYPQGVRVAFAHGDALAEIEEVKQELSQSFPQVNFSIGSLGPVVGAHTGKGVKGMGIMPNLPQ
ncbi:DegV family protein [Aerococcaceae bacterium NML160702]|nr:DegV family protein [Aerococcaceae bacterium NML171108]MCW6681554.1 DegV family protein [Aerococcaceae bacterium NML160702]